MNDELSRRGFVRGAVAAFVPMSWSCLNSPTDSGSRGTGNGRLSVRPHAPTLDAEAGETALGLGFPSDGLLYVPEAYDPEVPTPMLVALHGATGRAENWAGLYDDCEERGMVLLAIDSRGRTWDRVGGFFGPDVQFIDRALDHAFDRVNVDPERIGLVGFSDGASYALSLGPSNGDLFKQLIAFSPGHTAPTDTLIGTPRIFVSHGREDAILFAETTRTRIVPALRSAGYDVTYIEFEGGHEVPPTIGAAALDWYLE